MRKPLKQFAEFQEKILKHNDDKGGWKECSLIRLYGSLHDELRELIEVLLDSNPIKDLTDEEYEEYKEQASKECADIANFAMMIYDNVNNPPKQSEGWR